MIAHFGYDSINGCFRQAFFVFLKKLLTYFHFTVKYFIKRGCFALNELERKSDVYFSDFHIHTDFSFDSKEKIDNVCLSAVNAGLSAIAITNHYDHDGIEDGITSLVNIRIL